MPYRTHADAHSGLQWHSVVYSENVLNPIDVCNAHVSTMLEGLNFAVQIQSSTFNHVFG